MPRLSLQLSTKGFARCGFRQVSAELDEAWHLEVGYLSPAVLYDLLFGALPNRDDYRFHQFIPKGRRDPYYYHFFNAGVAFDQDLQLPGVYLVPAFVDKKNFFRPTR